MLHDLIGDVRASLRHLARAPGFTAGAVLVLTLGIGLNAAVFGLSYALVFASRPFADPGRLVQLYSRHAKEADAYRAFSHGAYEMIAGRSDVFRGVLAHTLNMVGVRAPGGGASRRTFAGFVSGNYFDVLGVRVAEGRGFTAEEARISSRALVAVASHAYWRKVGAPQNFVGTTLLVNERPVTVVGIAPAGFTGTMMVFGPELFLPLGALDVLGGPLDRPAGQTLADPEAFDLFLVGRLADGLERVAATPRLAATSAALAEALPAQYRDHLLSVDVLPRFGTSTSPRSETVATTLAVVFLGLTASVLLIVCLNLASVVVARGQVRHREIAIRLALGAGRGRVVRQFMVEALVVAVAGATGGILIGLPAIRLSITTLLARVPVSLTADADMLAPTVAGALGFGVVAALVFALGPALAHSREQVTRGLTHQLGEGAPTRRRRMPAPLVTAQVTLSLALLVVAGLFVRFAQDGTSADVARGSEGTVVADVDAGLAGLDEAPALATYAAVVERLQARPDVEAVGLAATIPFGSVRFGQSVRRAGTRPAPGDRPASPAAGQSFGATWNAVTPDYFATLGVRLLRGRVFTESEAFQRGATPVAILNEVVARRLWPDGDALGQSVHVGDDPADSTTAPISAEVVGIVAALPDNLFAKEPSAAVYVPLAHGYKSALFVQVRPRSGTSDRLIEHVRADIQAAAPALPIFGVTTYGAHLETSIEYWGLKALAAVVSAVGGFAALIALIGVYGAKSYAVARRTREIGVRLAVGASPATVGRLIVGEALVVATVGVVVGSALGLGLGQVLASLFVDMAAFDPRVSVGAALTMLAACALAAWVPARRAARIDPSSALRAD